LPLFRRRRDAAPEVDDVLYVHLADDGGIFAVRGDTGAEAWISQGLLREELGRIKAANGTILYSRDAPDRDPPPIVEDTFRLIADSGVQIKVTAEPHPNTDLPGNATTLMTAAYGGDKEVVADLVERGADLEARDVDGYTPLMYAANAGHVRAAEILLEAGAEVNAADNQGSTPIMFAAQHGHAELVRVLIGAGAGVNARGTHGLTALGFARQNDHDETAHVLEGAGALPD
jgi:hypothetical protein